MISLTLRMLLSLILLNILPIVLSIQLVLSNKNVLVFNSSMKIDTISVSMSSKNSQQNSSFYVTSQFLSPILNAYQIIHGENKIETMPALRDDQINFNDFDRNQNQYWLAIKHKTANYHKNTDNFRQVHFVGMKISSQNKEYFYILPTFPQPFSFLQLGTIYKCENVIVAIFTQESLVDIAMFSRSGAGSWKNMSGKWDWNWDNIQNNGRDYGRFTRKDKLSTVKIQLKSGHYCQFQTHNLSRANNEGLKNSRYLTIQQVLQHSTALKISKPQQQL